MVFRLGVAGRRFVPRQLTPSLALQTTVTEVLRWVSGFVVCQRLQYADAYSEEAPVLRIVSSLAEGADQLVAELALKAGFQLQCPFPFPQAVYRRLMAAEHPPAAEAFDRLLREASAGGRLVTLELDGDPKAGPAAYRASGRIVAAQSDLLLALWEGGPDDSDCGTVFAIRYALLNRIPVLWIDLTAPHGCRLLTQVGDLPETLPVAKPEPEPDLAVPPLCELVKEVVKAVLVPPAPGPGDNHRPAAVSEIRLSDYLTEPRRKWNLGFPWKLFRDLVAVESPEKLSELKVQRLEAPAPEEKDSPDWLRADEWPADQPAGRPPPALDHATDRLHPHYGWADRLANWYADRYRSSFLGIYVLGTAAVAVVLVCLLMGWWTGPQFHTQEMICTALEVVLIGSIVWLIHCGRKRQWHGRWVDCRLLAERIRELRFLAGTGGARPLMRHPAFAGHLASYGDPDATWMAWLVRALERELGLLPVTINAVYLKEFIGHVRVALVAEQEHYHHITCHRMARIDHRLHGLGQRLFTLTLAVCAGHLLLLLLGVHLPVNAVRVALGVGAAFPLLGAALTALRDQGEFQRVAARSKAMRQRMVKFRQELDALERQLDAGEVGSRAVFELVQDITQSMVHENLGWRVIFQDRPLREPG